MARPDGRASARKSFVLLVTGTVVRSIWCIPVIFFLCSVSSADVPSMINYQGKLTDAGGGLVNDTVQMTFSIYPDTTGSPANWTETQNSVIVKNGIFNVLLGSINPIGASVFDGNIKYLGVQVESDPEMSPLKPMVSVPYAFRAGGGGGVNCHDCDTVFVNVDGPDSVVATTGSAFLGKASGSSAGELFGVTGYVENSSSGPAYGGYFSTSSSGTGAHYGVKGDGLASSTNSSYGVKGHAQNTSTGDAYGGSFTTSSSGTGSHYGVYSSALGSSSASTYGYYGNANNTSTGVVYGGNFQARSYGTGSAFGVAAEAQGSSGPSYAFYGFAQDSLDNAYGALCMAGNNSSGNATGGYFQAGGSGSGYYYGVNANVYATTPHAVYGVQGWGSNPSTGTAYGGNFYVDDNGTGTHYGSYSTSWGNSSSSTYGCYGYAANTSSGTVYAGYFEAATGFGSGTKYGVYASAPGGRRCAGYFVGNVRITDSLVVLGAKSAGVKVDNGEYRLLYSQESPEVWFEDFGEGQLVNGRTHIDLDPLFLETVTLNSQHPMKVFIQLTSGEPMNVVVHKGITGFDIEAEDISSNATFDYRVVAKRKGYENIRLAKMGGPTPEEVAAEQERHLAEREVERARMEQERMKMEKERESR